jgi:hypothetical protein
MHQHVLSPDSHSACHKYERPKDDDDDSALSQFPGQEKRDQWMNKDRNALISVDRKRKQVERR